MADADVNARLKAALRAHSDFPKPGILFQDIFPVFQDPVLVRDVITELVRLIRKECETVDAIVGLDARGFLLGPMVAIELGCRFVPIRKAGKLPGPCYAVESTKEYGADQQEIQQGSIPAGARVVIIDDLLATGGTLKAAATLIKQMDAIPVAAVVLIELEELPGRALVEANGVRVLSMLSL